MEITKRAIKWTSPTGYVGDKVCDIAATHALTHSVSNRFGRKKAPAVAVCVTTLGCKLHLCAHCLSFVEVLQWLDKIGYHADLSTGALSALGYVWRAEGFVIPEIKAFPGSYQTLGAIAHNLAKLEKAGLVKRAGNRYLMRDACPSCLRRVCSKECSLYFGAEFAPRREQGVSP